MKRLLITSALAVLIPALFFYGCSKEYKSYDDMVKEGAVEKTVRKDYRDFFNAINQFASLSEPDSVLMKKLMTNTDVLVADLREYPKTVQSRLALDGLSYAANDLALSSAFDSVDDVLFFWRNGLLAPIFMLGRRYVGTEMNNESTILQLITALQRGMADRASDDMLMEMIQLVGPAPPKSVFELCRADSMVLGKAFDLLIYSRSLQEMGPPLWMMSGSWFLAVAFDEPPLHFYSMSPLDIDGNYFLTFRSYTPGEVYEFLHDDPAPKTTAGMDAWLDRAAAALDSLRFNRETVEKIMGSSLPVFDSHNYYDNYLLGAKADTVKTEYRIYFKRERVEDGYDVAGVDSLEVLMTEKEIMSNADTVTPLRAFHYVGDSVVNGRFVAAKQEEGIGFLIPMGYHDLEKVDEIRRGLMPEIKVNTN